MKPPKSSRQTCLHGHPITDRTRATYNGQFACRACAAVRRQKRRDAGPRRRPKVVWSSDGRLLSALSNEARERGERTFDPGVPCVRGRVAHRWVNNSMCVECKRSNDIAYNNRNIDAHRARSSRSALSRPEQIKQHRKNYYRENSAEAKVRARLWHLAHPDKTKASRKAYKATHREQINRRQAEHRRLYPEKYRAWKRQWRKDNPEKIRAEEAVRRARKVGSQVGDRKGYAAFVKWSRSARSVPCYWCNAKTTPSSRHRDHVIPLAKGGADSVGNLCISCPACNARKNAKMPEEFSGQGELRLA